MVAAKNYVIQTHPDWAKAKELNEDGTVKIKHKGSKFRDSKKEPALKKFLLDAVNTFLDDVEDVNDEINKKYIKACKGVLAFEDVNDWTVKRSVSKSIMQAKDKPNARANERNPWLAIEEALNEKVIESIQEGDKVWLYRTMRGQKQLVVKGEPQFKKNGDPRLVKDSGYKFPELYNKDQDTEHYLKRVYDTLMLLEDIIDKNKYLNYSLKTKRKYLEAEL